MAKPKNKKQRFIIDLSSRVPLYTDKHIADARSLHEKYVTTSYTKQHFCLECGHKWDDNAVHTKILKGIDCPKCKEKLKYTERNMFMDWKYYGEITTIEGYQLVRIYISKLFYKKNQKPEHSFSEVMQHFISDTGEVQTIESSTHRTAGISDNWILHSPLEFRTNGGSYGLNRQRAYPWKYYPKVKVLPIFKRNGFKTSPHWLLPQALFSALAKNNFVETLFKCKQYELVREYYEPKYSQGRAEDLIPQVKIALRHNYRIKEVSDWFDYVSTLQDLGKDIRNPKYICPENFHKAHQDALKELEVIKEKERAGDYKHQENQYILRMQKFFDLKFGNDKVLIEPLKSLEDFKECGKALKHCVFAKEYYKKRDSLIFKATVKGVLMETIELSLKDFRILQSRGWDNKPSRHHKAIVEIVKQNTKKVQKLAYRMAS